ncbi:Malonyl-CoA decarboxylase, mitochondrial [Zancudomyces culisetae]|nr:Malonyl-CoA decarboxylase, mitochondrial [Zancudomyces culisetae]OMH83168.1 Malonyl-CoA decarboxylase, mitochondrial [Zancudomyces culisetae]|eukprot:OMH79280.1 Malonyl-CoA decarboxylase, mitochondrial [Zancudomyces culisetae]
MPLFTTWLKKWLTPDICENPDMRITEEEEKVIAGIVPEAKVWTEGLRRILEDREIAKNVETLNQIRSVILKLGARYILKEKRGETKIAFDPVANFHLKNGASVHCINWMADPSSRGIRNSLGLMCNYNYITDAIEKNNAGYLNEGKIAISGTDLIYKSLDF